MPAAGRPFLEPHVPAITARGYQSGFGSEFATEAIAGALPVGQNSPQKVAHGLYAEQLTGTAFTAPRGSNRRSWLYRIRPAVTHGEFTPFAQSQLQCDFGAQPASPNQLRWSPLPLPELPTDFVEGLYTMGGNGSPDAHAGVGIHLYAANRDMVGRYFYNADGEMLIVPQLGALRLLTELGVIEIEPQQIAVIPRGVRFRVELPDGPSRGYLCENYGALLKLPDLGPIGSNGLASRARLRNPARGVRGCGWRFRADRQVRGPPVACADRPFATGRGGLARQLRAVPLRPAPFQHHWLDQLRPPGSVDLPGAAFAQRHAGNQQHGLCDLPPRWLVAQNTFRPPWFHRNIASEFMGLVHGAYDAKAEGFVPAGHRCTTA